jgi:hypothetical protein
MMKRKINIVFLIFILFNVNSLDIFAQREPVEFSIFGGGGLSFFGYQTPLNKVSSIGYNFDIGVGFTGFVSQMCGFHVGVGLGAFNVKANAGDFKIFMPGLTDINDYPYELNTTLIKYSETHKTMFLNIPLMFQFQTKQGRTRGDTKRFYAMAGAKLLMLFNRTADVRITTIYNAAYYPEFDNWAATQKFAGLGEFSGKKSNEKLKVDFLPMFAFETGIKWYLGKTIILYTGVYFDCGLTDPTKNNRKPVNEYNAMEQPQLLAFYKKSFLMDTGIKLRLAFYKPSQKMSHKKLPCHYTY